MKIHICSIDEIEFLTRDYSEALINSLLRMGQGFPIYVKRQGTGFLCIDGHKRLNAIHDILNKDPNHSLKNIKIIILNSARTPSGTAKNHH